MVIDRLIRMSGVMIVVWVLLSPTSAWATLQAYVDRNPVAEDESFMLTLESDGDIDGRPDLSPLRQDFDIQEQGRNSSLSIVNGAVSRKIQWQISLMAKRSGRLMIPAIEVGKERSSPLALVVSPARQAPNAPVGGGDLFMDVTLEPHSVYVQQQAIYTVRLYHAVNLGNGSSLSEPTFSAGNAVVERLGKDKEFETVRNGRRYAVLERRYAIYPQKSGGIEIPAPVFDGQIVQGGRGFFAFDPFNQRVRHKRLRSKALHLDVRAVPTAFHGAQWLPATSLNLDEHWAPDPPHFTVGQAVTRILRIRAEGLTASQLPSLTENAPVNGLKQYPDQPAFSDSPSGNGLNGSRTEKIAYIPQLSGRFQLPAIEIPWWNTKTDRQEVARLPERTITIESAAGNGSSLAPAAMAGNPVPPPVSKAPARPSEVSPRDAGPASGSVVSVNPQGKGYWQWIALVLGLGWVMTAIAWWWRARKVTPQTTMTDDHVLPLRDLERTIQARCRTNDADGAKAAILVWARQRWPERPPLSLTAVARNCPDALAAELIELDRALYASGETTWRGDALWRQFTAAPRSSIDVAKTRDMDLEPLYPIS